MDGAVIPQSQAQLRYVGKLGGLYPTDPVQAAFADAAIDAVMDIHNPVSKAQSYVSCPWLVPLCLHSTPLSPVQPHLLRSKTNIRYARVDSYYIKRPRFVAVVLFAPVDPFVFSCIYACFQMRASIQEKDSDLKVTTRTSTVRCRWGSQQSIEILNILPGSSFAVFNLVPMSFFSTYGCWTVHASLEILVHPHHVQYSGWFSGCDRSLMYCERHSFTDRLILLLLYLTNLLVKTCILISAFILPLSGCSRGVLAMLR